MKKLLIISISFFILGCVDKSQEVNNIAKNSQDNYQETIVIAQKAETKTLEPQKAADTVSTKIIEIMFEPLIYMDENFNLIPSLAEKWERKDANNMDSLI